MTLEIQHEDGSAKGAFFVLRDGGRIAEMTYVRTGPGSVTVDHTWTHDSLRGQGVARQLLDALVGWARSSHTRVKATCPYALAQFTKDASIRDVYEG